MATLPTNFRQALHNVQPAEDEKNAADAHDQVSDVLKGDPNLRQLGIDPVLIGSYAREVSIKRVKDVDPLEVVLTAIERPVPNGSRLF